MIKLTKPVCVPFKFILVSHGMSSTVNNLKEYTKIKIIIIIIIYLYPALV